MYAIFKRIYIIITLFVAFYVQSVAQISIWNGSVARWTQGDGSELHPYLIDSASHLAYLAQSVKAGVIYADTCFRLTTDIDLNFLPWTSIGVSNSAFYIGDFDGNQHTVFNLNCKDTISHAGISYIGLFGYVMDAYISNLHVGGKSDILVSFSSSNNFYVGGIAGYAFASEIHTCSFEGTVSAYAISSYAYVGGIIGFSASGTIVDHCLNKGKVFASSLGVSYGGGIIASCDNAAPSIQYCCNEGSVFATAYNYVYAGGIIAKLTSNASVLHCFNKGNVETFSNYYTYVGGLVGLGSNCYLRNSFNEGKITAVAYDYAYAGGLIGFTEFPSIIENAYNRGEITSNSYYFKSFTGGIVGNIYNYSYISTTITACYNTGKLLSISSLRAFSGGICGEVITHAEIAQAYFLQSSIVSPSNLEGESVDAAFLRSYAAVDSLNQFNQAWIYDRAFDNDGYPLLLSAGNTLVITENPSIQTTGATLYAMLVQRGDTVLQRGFMYKKYHATNFTIMPADTNTHFHAQLSDLQKDTLYEYKAFAILQTDTIFGNPILFTTGELEVQTLAAKDVEPHQAVLNGSVNYGMDSVLSKGFQWKPVPGMLYNNLLVSHVYFSAELENIFSNTNYIYRAFVVTAYDTIFGNTITFTTPIQPSLVITETISNVTPYAATLNAHILYGDDHVLQRGFEWYPASETESNFVWLSDTGFNYNLTNLQQNNDYFYRAFVVTDNDTLFGAEMAFTTLQACVLTTYPASMIDLRSAVLNGSINAADEQIYMQGFAWKVYNDTNETLKLVYGSAISDTLIHLLPNTNYSYRVFAVTANGIFYGNKITFQTLAYTADVSTYEASNITTNAAVLHGEIKQGEETVIMQGFEWKSNSDNNYTIVRVDGDEISDTLKNLQPHTSYFFRAFMLTESGTLYGETLQFQTLNDVGYNHFDDQSNISIFPNPVTDKLTLITKDNMIGYQIDVVDVFGRCMDKQIITSSTNLVDFNTFDSGIYFLRVIKNNQIIKVIKIIKS